MLSSDKGSKKESYCRSKVLTTRQIERDKDAFNCVTQNRSIKVFRLINEQDGLILLYLLDFYGVVSRQLKHRQNLLGLMKLINEVGQDYS